MENDSPKSFLKFNLQQKRLKGEGTDVTLVCKDDSTCYHAHKLILTSASPYFDKMFAGSFDEAKTGVSNMDFDSKTMSTVLDFVYLENDVEIQIDNLDQADNLLQAAHMLEMTTLFGSCCGAAQKLVTAQHFTRIADWDRLYENPHTEVLLDNYVKDFGHTILAGDLYLQYTTEQFKILIGQLAGYTDINWTQLKISKIIKWIKVDPARRNQQTTSLFSEVNIPRLPSTFVQSSLLAEEIVKTNCEVLVQLMNSLL